MGTKTKLREEKRRAVVEAIAIRQEPVHLVARIYNIPQRTVFDWLSSYRSGGWDALKEGARSGRPRKLSANDMKWVYHAVTQGNPLNYQFEFCLWTLNIIRTMIEQERGIALSKSAVALGGPVSAVGPAFPRAFAVRRVSKRCQLVANSCNPAPRRSSQAEPFGSCASATMT